MLSHLVAFSIRFRGIVLAIACLIVVYGTYTLYHARYDVYPEFAPPQVVIQTEAPGLSPEQVEALVTHPVESALNGASGLTDIRSQSVQGLSVVTTVFEDGTDVYLARQMVSERLSEAVPQMPPSVRTPVMAPLTGASGLVLVFGLTSSSRTPMDVRTFADWTLRPRLLAVPGVARVSIFGGEVKQLQIQALPDRMAALGVSMQELLAAARLASGIRGGGFIETDTQRIVLQSQGQAVTADQLGHAALRVSNGHTVRLQDVAHVTEAARPKIGDASIDGESGALILVSSQYGANTPEVTVAVEAALAELKPAIAAEGLELHASLFRPATFIDIAIGNMTTSLLIGAALVAAVLFVFLFNFRTGLISITAIPLSLLTAAIVLQHMGQSLNTLTLGGLAIAIGEVVDDAIIDVENIFRRLRETPPDERSGKLFQIVLDASLEVRSAVVYATFIVALVFLPVLALSGVQGSLFSPLAAAYILAIMTSLLVALTVTPAMAYLLLPGAAETARTPAYINRSKRWYERVLRSLARKPKSLMLGSAGLVILALAITPFLGGEFLPELREGHFILHMVTAPGTSLKESMRLGGRVTDALLENPSVLSVAQQAGRAELFDDTWGPNYSEIHIDLKPLRGREAKQSQDAIREIADKFPGAVFSIKTFLTERMEEVISGSRAAVVVNVFGEDLDTLDRVAKEVLATIAAVPGAAEPQISSPPGAPQLMIRLEEDKLLQFGFQPVAVLEAIEAAYQGIVVGQTYEGYRVFDITVILDESERQFPEQVGDLLLRNEEGLAVPLRELADIYQAPARSSIDHEDTRRRQTVLCDVEGRDLASFVDEARRTVDERVKLPPGVYISFGGAASARTQARQELMLYSLIAGAGILMLLSMSFPHWRNSLLVLVNLPFALAGGVLAAYFTGGNLSVGSMVGFVTLFGITVRNSIMMLSHFEHLVTVEGEVWGIAAAVRGASERLLPVLMTAITTGLGLLPLAIGSGEAGREIEGPMAIIILGGLATSTVLNLLVLPTLALYMGDFSPRTNGKQQFVPR